MMDQQAFNAIIAENMAKYRKAANLTQSELAERLNYSDKSISKWEQGNGMPDIFVLYKLAELYGVTVNDFFCKYEKQAPMPHTNGRLFSRLMILIMSVGLCWLVAVTAFVAVKILAPQFSYSWLFFIYALPATCIVATVLGAVWKFFPVREISVSALIWTLLLSVCLTVTATIEGAENVALIFLLGIPLQILVVLWFFFRRKVGKKNKKQ
ncbi:MAG: helix-turn-helix transcriptional regulator [Clostridia bacterium]|nr:helix-turn-helix transcriptional regulator [Clostridia bacterium]